jgi:Flp pilus assembly protein TadG
MHSIFALLKRFHADERGVFAIIFGLMAIVLVALAGAAVDYTAMETARTRAQIALDSAALGLAPTIYDDATTDEQLLADAQAIVSERLNGSNIEVEITDVDADTGSGTLRFDGRITVGMAFVQLVGIDTLTAGITSEATKGSINIEVAVSLDVSGSMEDYIGDLQDGLDGLIGLVVSDVQEPTYSKMAIVPWSTVVYAGDYAEDLRGDVPAGKGITNLNWANTAIGINGATRANPVVITTASAHGYVTGDIIYINSVSGMTQLNGNFYQVYKTASHSSSQFALRTLGGSNVNGTGYNNYSSSSSDRVRKCLLTSCEVVVTATGHGFATNDNVRITGTSSGTWNNKTFQVTNRSANTFSLNGTSSTSTSSPIASNGTAYCTTYGCEYYYFANRSSSYNTYRITDCVTERATDTYTDAPPSTTLLGRNYHSNSNGDCDTSLEQGFTPLTADKDVLYAESEALDDYLYTSGHLGTAWAWYLLAPDWGYLWPNSENVPAAYGAENTMKVAILMTDGAYNRQFCNGVSDDTINCDAPDDSTTQARELCAAMKANDKNIVIYTVGFNIAANSSPWETMRQCASDESKFFQPSNGTELVEDFAEIGQNITDLRLSM